SVSPVFCPSSLHRPGVSFTYTSIAKAAAFDEPFTAAQRGAEAGRFTIWTWCPATVLTHPGLLALHAGSCLNRAQAGRHGTRTHRYPEPGMGRVQNKVALVTGAAQGLGAATATLLARQGAKVLLTDINAEEIGRASCRGRAYLS